jgi:hypothetical protein
LKKVCGADELLLEFFNKGNGGSIKKTTEKGISRIHLTVSAAPNFAGKRNLLSLH